MANTFTLNNATYIANKNYSFCVRQTTEGNTRIKKAEFLEAQAEYEKATKGQNTSEKCLAAMPAKYTATVNKKGHILIQGANKRTLCRIRPLKDGMYIFPGKDLKATRTDWEYHKGWANEYTLKVSTWAEAEAIIDAPIPEPEKKKETAEAES